MDNPNAKEKSALPAERPVKGKPYSDRLALRVTTAVVGLVLAAVAVSAFTIATSKYSFETPAAGLDVFLVPAVLAAAACAAFVVYAAATIGAITEHRGTDHQKPAANITAIRRQASEFSATMSLAQANYFRGLVATPSNFIDRLTEVVEPLSRSILITSTYNVLLPSDLRDDIVTVALLGSPKGLLETGMKVYDQAGLSVPYFSQQKSMAFAVAAIRFTVGEISGTVLSDYLEQLEDDLIREIATSSVRSPEEASKLESEFATGLLGLGASQDEISHVMEIIGATLRNNVLCVDLFPPRAMRMSKRERMLRVTVERRSLSKEAETTFPLFRPRGPRRISAALRTFFGILPTVIHFPLDNAERASSYHVEMHGPPGTYLARQDILDGMTGEPADLTDRKFTFTQRHGQRHSHLYLRGVRSFSNRVLVNHFYERMPGSMGASALSSAAAVFLIWLCALNSVGIGPDEHVIEGANHHTDLVAILLAFPIVIAIWAGFDKGNALGDVLLARLTKIVTIIVSVAAAGLYVLGDIPFSQDGHSTWAQWSVVVAVATLNSLATVSSWIIRLAVHARFVGRPPLRN